MPSNFAWICWLVENVESSLRFILHCRISGQADCCLSVGQDRCAVTHRTACFPAFLRTQGAKRVSGQSVVRCASVARYLHLSLDRAQAFRRRPARNMAMKVVRDTRSPGPLSKAGNLPVTGMYPWNSVASSHLRWRSDPLGTPRKPPKNAALTLQERRHSFAIEALPKSDKSSSRPYLYMCVRCKWTFRVNDPPGSIISIDQAGEPLAEPENSRRAATFTVGPCPAFKGPLLLRKRTIEIPALGWFARTRYGLMRQVSAMWRRWTGESAREIRIDPAATTTIMAEDLLR